MVSRCGFVHGKQDRPAHLHALLNLSSDTREVICVRSAPAQAGLVASCAGTSLKNTRKWVLHSAAALLSFGIPRQPALTREVIGKRLRAIRQLRERTQQEVAMAIGVGKEVVCRTERGEREMAYHEAVEYARVLCFCLNAFARTEADGQWNISACMGPYAPPQPEQPA